MPTPTDLDIPSVLDDFASFEATTVCALIVGRDLVLTVDHIPGLKAWEVRAYDSDSNWLKTLARADAPDGLYTGIRMLAQTARSFYPSHV